MAPSPNAIGIIVNDMGRTLAFYRLLGLDVPAAADTEQHVECTLAGGMRLMWDSVELVRSLDPHWSPPQGSARMALAFECADPAEVDRVYAEVVGAGYDGHREPWDAFWGQRYAMLRDPDGNAVDLYAALPVVD
ncbi:MAG TPA: VOC family protein [Pseudonocardiaceae bacterium]|nr:VOC family protein [Pseudonocardiaceae bacterium]